MINATSSRNGVQVNTALKWEDRLVEICSFSYKSRLYEPRLDPTSLRTSFVTIKDRKLLLRISLFSPTGLKILLPVVN